MEPQVSGIRPKLRRWWPAIRRTATVAFFVLVVSMLVAEARKLDWPAVFAAMRAYDTGVIVAAAALTVASHAIYGCFDLLARTHTGHRLPRSMAFFIATTSYAFNLNLGGMVGGVGFRYRLYSRAGLCPGLVTQIIGFSVITNWLGYVLVSGVIFALHAPNVPWRWGLGPTTMRVLGAALVLIALAWLVACACLRDRRWQLRGVRIRLPRAGIALAQMFVAAANWLLVAAVLDVFLPPGLDFGAVLTVYLVAAVAAGLVHIPAGLGVLEAIFVLSLGDQVAKTELLAALLSFRAVYYLGPLALAVITFLGFEATTRSAPSPGDEK